PDPTTGLTGAIVIQAGQWDMYEDAGMVLVDQAPASHDDAYTALQGQALTVNAHGVLANDTDAENDPLAAYLVSGPSHGQLTLQPDGSFPPPPYVKYDGTDIFRSLTNDGYQDSNNATATLTVIGPPVASNDAYSTYQDMALAVNAAAGVLANDTDPQQCALTA